MGIDESKITDEQKEDKKQKQLINDCMDEIFKNHSRNYSGTPEEIVREFLFALIDRQRKISLEEAISAFTEQMRNLSSLYGGHYTACRPKKDNVRGASGKLYKQAIKSLKRGFIVSI